MRCGSALALAALLIGCASAGDPVGYTIVAQDRYDFLNCTEIINQRNGQLAREKELVGLVQKAEASPAGFIVSYSAYRSELVQVRALIVAADRAAKKNGCEIKK
jgi:hypothetical protein